MNQQLIINKIAEAKSRGFVDGSELYSLYYPTSKDVQIGDTVKFKTGYNLLWVRAKTSWNDVMDVVIYDFGKDEWAKHTPTAKTQAIVKVEYASDKLSIRKGDMVSGNINGETFMGKIIKYPSNSAIVIETNSGEITVNKVNIVQIVSKA